MGFRAAGPFAEYGWQGPDWPRPGRWFRGYRPGKPKKEMT
jgi:hypothetical protein